jgi:hypothetical protein
MYQNFKDLLSAFHAHGVKYLVVGGYAVIFHAQPRSTKDIDLLIQTDSANARAIYTALANFGLPLGDIRAEDFTERGSFFRSATSRRQSIFFPRFPGCPSSMLGSGASRELSILIQALPHTSSPPKI